MKKPVINFRTRMNPLRAMILCRFGGVSDANNEVHHNGWTATTNDEGKFLLKSPCGELNQEYEHFEQVVNHWQVICEQ